MTDRIRIPRRFDTPIRLFGRFTPGDIARLGIPAMAAVVLLDPRLTTANIIGAALAALVASVWYLIRPAGQPLETHVYHGIRNIANSLFEASEQVAVGDRYVKTGDGSVAAVVEVEPVNIDLKTGDEQAALHAVQRELYSQVTYPVQIHSRQQPLDFEDYLEHIENQDTDLEHLKDGFLELCQEIADGRHTYTRHYVTVRVSPGSREWLRSFDPESPDGHEHLVEELEQRVGEVFETLDTSELSANRLTGKQLTGAVQRFYDPDPQTSYWFNSQRKDGVGEYSKTLVLSDFPSDLEVGWTLQLLRSDIHVDITQVVKPCQPGAATKQLNRVSERLQAEIDSLLHQGHNGTNRLESTLKDAEWMLDLLADRRDNPVHYAAYVTVHSPDREACENAIEQVRDRCETMRIQTRNPVFRTDHALATWQPLQPDLLDSTRLMPARSAAAGFPFGTQSIDQDKGVLYGTDTADQAPVILDRFQWSSHSMARMGMVGSGKSYASKLEILRSHLAYTPLQTYILDPKNEYSDVIRALNGETHTLDNTDLDDLNLTDSDVVGFQVESRGQRENVDLLADAVEHLYQTVSQDRKPTLVVVDEARILMNDEEGRQLLNQFVLEARDTNTAVTLISQNASHFTYCREGREILDNMPGKVFMKHDRVPQSVVDYFDLSQREKQQLYELRTGTDAPYSEAIVRVSNRVDTKLRIESTPEEHGIIKQEDEP